MKGKLRTAGWSIVFLVLSFLSLSWGIVEITPKEALVYTWQAVLGMESGSISSDVVQYLRLPHFILAFAVGWGLALCGTVMQAVMRNPLADPYLLGISSGAGLGSVIAMALGADAYLGVHGVSICAFLGAVGISLVILFVASAAGKGDNLTLLLVGFAMNALCSAALSFIIQAMADTHKTKSVQFWLMGNIMADSWISGSWQALLRREVFSLWDREEFLTSCLSVMSFPSVWEGIWRYTGKYIYWLLPF